MSGQLRRLLWDNPMNLETTRVLRRFLSVGGVKSSRRVNRAAFATLSGLYVWMLVSIAYYREDMSSLFLWLELITLTLAIPASVYAAISGERERLTWDSLILTRLSPARLLVGKLLWRTLMIGAIMVLFFAPALWAHGLATNHQADYTWSEMWQTQGITGAWSLFLLCFTLMVSSKTKRSVTTLALTTAALFSFLVLLPGLYSVFGGDPTHPKADGNALALVSQWILWHHPLFALEWLHEHRNNGFDQMVAWCAGHILPAFYLGFAAICIVKTLSALRRLGLPTGGLGKE